MTTTRTRFAPSPTGHVHVGNARTALFSALLSVRDAGSFILRIEDTDAARSTRAFEDALRDDLTWLGLSWQEGPDIGGSKGPYRQSERGAMYQRFMEQLAVQQQVYPCFCTNIELEMARKVQLAAGQPPRYAGTCALLSTDEIEARLAKGQKPALRFRVPEQGETTFDDLIRGRQAFAHKDIGDFIIRRADGSPAFFFSNALDDALMGVTHVLRGEDHLANTPRQLLLLQALGLRIPRYGHLSMIISDDGQPLSKRHGSASLRDLREAGFLPSAILNYLARLGHSYIDNTFMTFESLAEKFDILRIGHSPSRFDMKHLEHWQKLAIAEASESELWEWIKHGTTNEAKSIVETIVPSDKQMLFVRTIRKNIVAASHIKRDYKPKHDAWFWAETFFGDNDYFLDEGLLAIRNAGKDYFHKAISCLKNETDYTNYFKALSVETVTRGPALYMPFRAAVTGDTDGPELKLIWDLLGPRRIEERLVLAREKI